MENLMKEKIEINLAEVEDLQLLPGVGPKLAARILAARPFTSLEDLIAVNGIGPATIEPWRDLIEFSTPPQAKEIEAPAENEFLPEPIEDDLPEEIDLQADLIELPTAEPLPPQTEPEAVVVPTEPEIEAEAAMEKAEEEAAEEVETPQTAPEPKETVHKDVTRNQLVWSVVLGMVLTFILATALSLGLLAGLNQGQLRFASPAEGTALNNQVEAITSRIDTQEQDLTALRARVDNLEALSDRMTAAETDIEDLQGETSALSTQIGTLEENVSAIQTDVEELQTQTQTFTTFFESMRDLFQQFFPTTDATE